MLGEPRSFAERAVTASSPVASPWDELVGPFVRSQGVQARLAITRQAVAAKAARRRLLRTITSDGEHLYPLWQFDGNRLVEGLTEVLAQFPESAVDGRTLAAWLRTPDPDRRSPARRARRRRRRPGPAGRPLGRPVARRVTSKVTLGDPSDLTGFPSVRPPTRLVRVCRATRGTWWFSADGSGRFDLWPPEGTCYLATDAYAAVREATRLGPVPTAWARARELRTVSAPEVAVRLAATTHKAAGRYGVTTELATVLPYDLPRRWAAAFRAAGFGGIRHQLRHDQRSRPSGVALFGAAGVGAGDDGERAQLTVVDVRAAGVAVFDSPGSSVLTIVE